jgi:hypothetical protein
MRSGSKKHYWCGFLLAACSYAAQVPAGTELHIRLTAKVSSADAKAGDEVKAVLIAPVVVNGQIVLPPGAEISGTVKAAQSAAADPAKPPTLELDFKQVRFASERDALSAKVAGVDNAKEKVDNQGVITGTPSTKTYTGEINHGLEKMSDSDRFSGLAGLLQAAKKVLVSDTDPNIMYDSGVELTLKTSAMLQVRRPSAGVAAEVGAIAATGQLADLVAQLPVRAMATDGRPSDLTNIAFVATEEQLRAAFAAAGWSTAARLNGVTKFETARALIEQQAYKEAPVSVLLVDGRPPDLVFQKQNDTFAARHHLRIWRQRGTFEGKPVWVCAATHDVGISFSERDQTFIHRIDSNVDNERAKVVNDLVFAEKVAELALASREAIPADAHNATGDALHTDGLMAVMVLR